MAVEYILEIGGPRSVVFVDLQSVISGILSITSSKNSLVQHVHAKVLLALELGLDLVFCWVPAMWELRAMKKPIGLLHLLTFYPKAVPMCHIMTSIP